MNEGEVSDRQVEVALSVVLVEWFREGCHEVDVETTLLGELGEEARGVVLTVGDREFRIVVEAV